MKRIIKLVALTLIAMLFTTFLFGCVNNKPIDDYYSPDDGIDYNTEIAPLVSGSYSQYVIVISEKATETEIFAANELKKYVAKVSGTSLKIVSEDKVSDSFNQYILSVGKTKFFTNAKLSVTEKNQDSFIIKSVDKVVVFCGYRDRGTLYSVYDFLEKILGIYFLTSKYEHIPQSDYIKMYKLDILEIPAFKNRSHHSWELTNKEFLAKSRAIHPNNLPGTFNHLGGGYQDQMVSSFHTMHKYVSHSEFYPIHPEWFSSDNVEQHQGVLSNGLNDDGTLKDMNEDGVVDDNDESYILELIKGVKRHILTYPDLQYIVLGQMDTNNVSRDPNCLRQIELFGGYMGQSIVFCNTIAREIKAWMATDEELKDREMYFVTTSYMYSFAAPTKEVDGEVVPAHPLVVPREDVYIYFAPTILSNNEPIENSKLNEGVYKTLNNFSKLTNNFWVYYYNVFFDAYLDWYPSMETLVPNIKFYEKLGVEMILAHSFTVGYYQGDLNNFLLSKLHWNPNRNINELTALFNNNYFGEKAGPIITELVDYLNAHYKAYSFSAEGKMPMYIYTYSGPKWTVASETLNYRFLKNVDNYVAKAYKAIAEDTSLSDSQKKDYNKNILTVEVQAMAMRYQNYDAVSYVDAASRAVFMNKFISTIRELGIFEQGTYTKNL